MKENSGTQLCLQEAAQAENVSGHICRVGGGELRQEASGEATSVTWPGGKGSLNRGPAGAQMDGSSISGRSGWRGRHPWRGQVANLLAHPLLSAPTRPGPGPGGLEAG